MVNEEDHLRLAAAAPGLALDAAWTAADVADTALAKTLPYAFHKDFGHLSACPTNLGTGMRASCLAHLPALALSGAIDKLLHELGQAGLAVRGLYGEGTKVLGELFQISNGTCLGATEAEYLSGVGGAVSRVIDLETAARERLADSNRVQLDDRIYRSLGALQQARLMSFAEAAHHLSLLRLGHAMGFKVPGSLALATELLLACQPAHMALRARRELSAAERDAARAALLREKLA
jgi:protein arginine kinase